MRVGIVGHEERKFTMTTQASARAVIRAIIQDGASCVISGESPLGGVDTWARIEAHALGVSFLPCPPTRWQWGGPGGFRERNLKIARESDIVHCVVVAVLPPDYTGLRFGRCYHDGRADHVKSGGCWTALQCRRRRWHIIQPDGAVTVV